MNACMRSRVTRAGHQQHQHQVLPFSRGCIRFSCPHPKIQPRQNLRKCSAAAIEAHTVLELQPRLSDLLTETTGPAGTIAWKAALDIALPILGLWLLLKLVNWAADQARVTIDARVASDRGIVDELKRQSTVGGLVLLALRTPAKYMLPPWLLAYTLRTALHIVDLVVNKYQPKLPQLAGYAIQQVSGQLVPLDAALAKLLSILVSEVILVRAIRSGNKELERVYLPLSSLVTWAAVLACALSICASLGVSLQPLLAVGGAGGIAAGFASQQLLLNLVAGVNIFLTRPFIAGDQVVFEGGANIVGIVEGVQMTRTLLRTADGTMVAVPNKLVSDLIVYNRTRTLDAGSNPASGDATAAPLRRVLCFSLQLDRALEPHLDDIRQDVRELLNQITKEQLIQSGLTPEPQETAGSSMDEDSSLSNSSILAMNSGRARDSGPAAAAAALAAAVASAVTGHEQEKDHKDEAPAAPAAKSADAVGGSEAAAALGVSREGSPEPEPLSVSITLKSLSESHISLFVRCEILLPSSSMMDAVEPRTEGILIATSGLVKEK